MGYSAWDDAVDTLPRGDEEKYETTDQKIAHAQVLALLAIAQELNHFNVAESPMGEAVAAALEAVTERE